MIWNVRRRPPEARAILWDFDGTLAHRPGMWRGCLIETLDEYEPGHAVSADDFVPFLRNGFPWHAPDVAHPELGSPAAWWERVEALLASAYEEVGLAAVRARELARLAHERYIDGRRGGYSSMTRGRYSRTCASAGGGTLFSRTMSPSSRTSLCASGSTIFSTQW